MLQMVRVTSCEGHISCFVHISKKNYVKFHFAPEVKQLSKLIKSQWLNKIYYLSNSLSKIYNHYV